MARIHKEGAVDGHEGWSSCDGGVAGRGRCRLWWGFEIFEHDDCRRRRRLVLRHGDARHARAHHRARGVDRQRSAALGAVLRLAVECGQLESAEAQARAGGHAARSGQGLDGRAVVRVEQVDPRRDRAGRKRRGGSGRADSQESRPGIRLRVGDPRVADGRQVEGILLPRRAERRRAGADRRRLHGLGSSTTRSRTRPASPTSSVRSSRGRASRSTGNPSVRRRPTSRRSSRR